MFEGQCAVSNKFATSVRLVRIAWLVGTLSLRDGYALATDAYISKTLGIALNKVQQAIMELEKDGTIVRASHFLHGKAQRRIWPSTKIIPPMAGGMDTPYDDQSDTPRRGGTECEDHVRAASFRGPPLARRLADRVANAAGVSPRQVLFCQD